MENRYRIGEFARQVGLTAYTLRYYENEGLIVPQRDANGQRYYQDIDVEWLVFLLSLRTTVMTMTEVKNYVQWRVQGDATIKQRKSLLEQTRRRSEIEIRDRLDSLKIVNRKIDWYNDKLDHKTHEKEKMTDYLKNLKKRKSTSKK